MANAARPAGHALRLEAITHRYSGTLAIDDVTLDIAPGDLVALLGPSGCGKTTLLRAVAGFVRPTAGDIRIDGASILHVPAVRRGMGIVFQNYALFPHMTVAENVAYGLEARRTPADEARRTVAKMLELVQLGHLAKRRPSELSGGQQQRVALARALAVRPRLLLLDEPLSALDKNLRLDMQIEIRRIQREFGITTVMVTHDQEEAMTMADKIAVLSDGRLQQYGAPTEVYDRPANVFVNSFIGTTNLIAATVAEAGPDRCRLAFAGGATLDVAQPAPGPVGAQVLVSVRPEGWRLGAPGGEALTGRSVMAMPLGPATIYDIAIEGGPSVKVLVPRGLAAPVAEGERIGLTLAGGEALSVFPAGAPQPSA
ncbi:ABC transporter ATP-binding protein [Acuticoccus sediminis]|uniref:ABC transporter ATP-binding protein n=1 Tax=Acuticoccus sediminis TaxID=2184697 RepID=UPI001CFDFA26|nr:ABC transporter ATP-binding protein [Acuticoccus sediminis]